MYWKPAAAAALSGALVFGTMGSAFADGHHFKDLGEAAWAQAAINLLAQEGLVNGVSTTSFAPNSPITLAQLAAILARYTGNVSANASFSTDVSTAENLGWFQNIGSKANPGEDATRAQAMAMIMAALNLTGSSSSSSSTSTGTLSTGLGLQTALQALTQFKDKGEVPDWAKAAMGAAVNLGLLTGSGGNLMPQGEITRAQLAVVLQRIEASLGAAAGASNTVLGTYVSSTSTATAATSTAEATQGTVTLNVNGQQETYPVASGAQIYIDRQSGTLANFTVGDQVLVALDSQQNAAVVVEHQPEQKGNSESEAGSVNGTVQAIGNGQITLQLTAEDHGKDQSSSSTPTTQSFNLDTSAVVVLDGVSAQLSTVQPGDMVRLVLDASGNVSMIIDRAQAASVTGTVVAVHEDWLGVQTSTGTLVKVRRGDSTQITLNGQSAGISLIAVGDQVTATGLQSQDGLAATSIAATGTAAVQGSGGSD